MTALTSPDRPADDDAALDDVTVTALLTSLFAGTRLFSGSDVTSPRAAYQDALYGRAVLIDLRPARARASTGFLGLDTVTFDADHGSAVAQVRRLAEAGPVTLVSSDGVLAARVAHQLRNLGLTWVEAVAGGFEAWRTAGLPVRHPSKTTTALAA